ncbi:MAG: ECF transporter S component [Promethearchaeota archaeon]
MTSPNFTLQPRGKSTLSLSIWIALLALFTASGVIFRQISIPIFPPFVSLTPGFLLPLLAGMILGPLGGALCGVFVGVSGALWEFPLIPLIGNIALGLSTGIPSFYRNRRSPVLWMSLCVVSAMIIGGFLPTFIVEVLVVRFPPSIATVTATIDALQALVWVVAAILLVMSIIDPILDRYRRPNEFSE